MSFDEICAYMINDSDVIKFQGKYGVTHLAAQLIAALTYGCFQLINPP